MLFRNAWGSTLWQAKEVVVEHSSFHLHSLINQHQSFLDLFIFPVDIGDTCASPIFQRNSYSDVLINPFTGG
jgi:hypothetical protein